jgi:hypothetical protein
VCWICLDAGAAAGGGGGGGASVGADGAAAAAAAQAPPAPLILPCRCPRPVHARCLARWQLQSAGTR